MDNDLVLKLAIMLGFAVLYGIWRRCYGGLDTPIWKKLFPKHGSALHRNFWRIVGIASVFCMSFFVQQAEWHYALVAASIMQFVMWDWSFGMYMQIGRHEMPPPAEDIDEYERQLFAKPLSWLIDESKLYGEFYDFLGMMLRFAVPGAMLALLPGFGMSMCLVGPIVALVYLIDIRLAEKGHEDILSRNFAELAAGFFVGLMFAMQCFDFCK